MFFVNLNLQILPAITSQNFILCSLKRKQKFRRRK